MASSVPSRLPGTTGTYTGFVGDSVHPINATAGVSGFDQLWVDTPTGETLNQQDGAQWGNFTADD